MNEFNSEYCNVKYIEADKTVVLTWKKFACYDDYRNPTNFAWNLLNIYPGSNLIVDARNGFEDEKADVEWGFSVLIPGMAKTKCKFVCFIMNEVNEIENEMDMWTIEFGKYFTVIKASDYEDAMVKMKQLFMVNVRYHIKTGKRIEFLSKVKEQGIIQASLEEPGNNKYEYYIPIDLDEHLCLMEIWTNEQMQAAHGKTEHYQKLQALKQEYVIDVEIKKYWITEA